MMLRLHSVLLPAATLPGDVAFYEALLESRPLFVDGDRYASFPPSDGVGIALAGGKEAVAAHPAMVLRTDDLDAAVARIVELGGSVLVPAVDGPHERRAVAADPSGNPLGALAEVLIQLARLVGVSCLCPVSACPVGPPW